MISYSDFQKYLRNGSVVPSGTIVGRESSKITVMLAGVNQDSGIITETLVGFFPMYARRGVTRKINSYISVHAKIVNTKMINVKLHYGDASYLIGPNFTSGKITAGDIKEFLVNNRLEYTDDDNNTSLIPIAIPINMIKGVVGKGIMR